MPHKITEISKNNQHPKNPTNKGFQDGTTESLDNRRTLSPGKQSKLVFDTPVTPVFTGENICTSDECKKYEKFKLNRQWNYNTRGLIAKVLFESRIDARVKNCGAVLNKEKAHKLGLNSVGRGTVSNIRKCSKRWLCPVCNQKIAAAKGEVLRDQLTNIMSKNVKLHFVTLTVRHSLSQALSELISLTKKGWRNLVRNSKDMRRVKGYHFTYEIRYSQLTGWHPHFHIILIADRLTAENIVNFWLENVDGKRVGQDIQQLTNNEQTADKIAKYKEKDQIVFEATGGQNKHSFRSLHPYELLECGFDDEFKKYAKATKGLNMSRASRSWSKFSKIEELTDTEAIETTEKLETLLGEFPPVSWRFVRQIYKIYEILEFAESGKNAEEIIKMAEKKNQVRNNANNIH